MKKVFLIGDSIRYGLGAEEGRKYGYGMYVKENLKGNFEVYEPDDNCRFLQYTLRYLHQWVAELENPSTIDVVHWNNGLWDCLRLFGDGPLTPVEMYKEYLVRVYNRIRLLLPNAKIIFALTTPVTEEKSYLDFTRKNDDIIRYNQAAIETLSIFDVQINDLYSVAKELRKDYDRYAKDWVHYNEAGSKLLAKEVISKINLLSF